MNNLSVNQPNTNVIGAENFLISYPDVPIHESENFLSYQNPCVPLTTILEENELDFDSPKKEKHYLSTKNVSYILDDTISDNPSLLKSTIVTTKNYVDSSAENSEIKSKYNDGMALNIDNERQVFDFEREMPTFFNVPSPLMYETRSVTNAVETGNATQDNVDDNILTNLIFENSSLYVQDVEYNISEESLESVIETIPKSKENLKELFTCELLTYQSNQNDYQISQDDSKQKINSWDDEFSVYPLNSSEKLSSKSDYQDNCLIDDISYFNLESTGEFFTDLVSGNAIQLINGKESAVNKENIECSTVQGILECKIDHPETSNENEISLQNDTENKPKTNLNNKNNLCGKLLSIPAPETFLPCYVCNICGRSFSDKYQLKNHLVTHLLIKPYTCTICNRQYVHEDQLKLHLRNHLEKKQYQCSICEKCFSCRDNLNSHFCIHSGKKNYICKTENNVHLAKKKELDIVHENIVSTMEDNLMLDFKTNQSEVCAENVISDLIVPKCIAGNAIQVTENEESGVIDKSINCSEDNYLMSEPKINQRGICAGNEKFILILPNYNIEKSTPLGEDKKTDAINENTGCSYKDNKPLLESGVNDLEMCTKNKYVFIIPNSSAKTAVQLVTSKEYDVKEEYNECFEDMTVKSTVNQIEMFTNDGKLTSNVLDGSESKTKININEGKSVSDNVSTLSVLKPPLPDNVCNICFKSFSRRYLKTHLLIHLSEKPFKCSVCKKQYIRKDQLRAHERKHSGEKTDYLVNRLCSQPQEKSYTCEEENRIQSAKVEKSDFAKENLIFFEKDNLLSGDKASLTNMIQEKGKCVLSIEDSENITDNFCKEKLVCDNPAVLSVSRPFCPDNVCNICNKSFTRKYRLKTHLFTHMSEKPYKCTICNTQYARYDQLKLHTRIHTGEKPFICNVCDKSFPRKGYLISHFRIHSGEKPFICKICSKAFAQKSTLEEHFQIHVNARKFKCNICDKCFNRRSTLRSHKMTHSRDKLYHCSICGMKFSVKSTLYKHIRRHTDVKQPHKCDICDKRFSTSKNLNDHYLNHSSELPFKCDMCNKEFKHKSELELHNTVHTSKKIHKCNICPKKFLHKYKLLLHLKMHSGDNRFNCDICNKTNMTKCVFKVHLRSHTGKKPYLCEHCNKAFSRSDLYDRHVLIHTGEKPFECDMCHKSFNQSSTLKRHQAVHMEKKPHTCDICNKGFTRKSHLSSHILTHSSEKSFTCVVSE